MPKGRGKNRGGLDKVVCVPFRTRQNMNVDMNSAEIAELDLKLSSLGARAVAVGSAFEFFRFRSLHAYQYTWFATGMVNTTNEGAQAASNLAGFHALSWIDSNAQLTGTPTTIEQMSQMEKFQEGNLRTKLRMKIARDQLAALPFKWFNTASTGASSDILSPGLFTQLCSVRTAVTNPLTPSFVVTLVVEGVLEFRGMITPALALNAAVKNPPREQKEETDEELEAILEETEVEPYLAVNHPTYERTRRINEAMKRLDELRNRGGLLPPLKLQSKDIGVVTVGDGAPSSRSHISKVAEK